MWFYMCCLFDLFSSFSILEQIIHSSVVKILNAVFEYDYSIHTSAFMVRIKKSAFMV